VCGEPVAPYDRPPLSKELRAEPFRPPEWYGENEVELLLGRRAAQLDVAARRVTLEGGAELGYDELIVATGARPRRLPMFAGRPNVHVLRTLADTRGLHDALVPGARLAIVGAGFIGQEVAATARGLGVDVTLIEAAEVPLAHVLGLRLGGWFADLHRAEGVRVELGLSVADAWPAVAGAPVQELVLSDGRMIPADSVLVGVGVAPETRWLAGSPLAGGVAVDDGARTVIPHVYAAGDVTGGQHWELAARLGASAARSILGLPVAPAPPASVWSDQYGVRIHVIGEAAGADAVEIDGDGRDFTAVLRRRGVVTGALLVGRPRELPRWRRQLAQPHEERSAA
jgi:3-phenylpropionate/trans-cinnamate dioxygenase ferredoxin reductase component